MKTLLNMVSHLTRLDAENDDVFVSATSEEKSTFDDIIKDLEEFDKEAGLS